MQAEHLRLAHDDLLVVNAARVSFAKQSKWIKNEDDLWVLPERDQRLIRFLAGQGHWTPFAHPQFWVQLSMTDAEMVDWLMARGAGFQMVWTGSDEADSEYMVKGSLFAWLRSIRDELMPEDITVGIMNSLCDQFPVSYHAYLPSPPSERGDRVRVVRPHQLTDRWMAKDTRRAVLSSATFRIRVPFFVARQLDKHQGGFVKSEVSRRYVTTSPTFWSPDAVRETVADKKQGSGGPLGPVASDKALAIMDKACNDSAEAYDGLVKLGVCPEQARTVLTMAAETEWYWTASLADYVRMAALRLPSDAMSETRQVVSSMVAQLIAEYPETWAVLFQEAQKGAA